MDKRKKHYWYRPFVMETVEEDTFRLTGDQYRMYHQVITAYWRSGCDLDYADLALVLTQKKREIDKLFSLVSSLEVVEGRVRHEPTISEYAHAVKKSEGARKAAELRWDRNKKPDGPSAPENFMDAK